MHDCNKKDCFFCYEMDRIYNLYSVKQMQTEIMYGWPKWEIDIIMRDFEAVPHIPGRTRREVMDKRVYIGRRLKLKIPKHYRKTWRKSA